MGFSYAAFQYRDTIEWVHASVKKSTQADTSPEEEEQTNNTITSE